MIRQAEDMSLEALLADPVVGLMMQADAVDAMALGARLAALQARKGTLQLQSGLDEATTNRQDSYRTAHIAVQSAQFGTAAAAAHGCGRWGA